MNASRSVSVLILFTLVVALIGVTVTSVGATEAPETEIDETYGGDSGDQAWSVLQISDSGYVLAGGTSSYGDGKQDMWLVRIDSNGNKEWSRTYGGNKNDDSHSLIQTSDGGYILAGYTYSYSSDQDMWLVKVGSNGNEEWNRTYDSGGDEYAETVVKSSDGGYALAGKKRIRSSGSDRSNTVLIEVSPTGDKEWSKTYDSGGMYHSPRSMASTSDGGYILATDKSSDIWLTKVDSEGNKEWTNTYGGNRGEYTYAVVQTSDGGYALGGTTYSYGSGSSDFWLVKTDLSGNMEWEKEFGGSESEFAHSLMQTSDGGYAITGYTESHSDGNWDMWLVKTDSSGAEEWNKSYGGSNDDYSESIIQTSDGGYAVAGTKSYRSNGDMWLIKTMENSTDNQPPVAEDFAVSPQSPSTGDSVTFDASGSTDPDGSIVSYEWSFGDVSTSTGVNSTHSYSSSGEYTVTLTVTDDTGATDTKTETVVVEESEDGQEGDFMSPVNGVSDEAWTAVTGDGNLSLGDLGRTIQGYQQNRQVNGVGISLGDLGSLIQHYQGSS